MSAVEGKYATDDVAHEADLSTPLHHGVIRYVPADDLDVSIRNSLPAKNDRPFVYVPVGYCHRNKDFVKQILSALDLNLPNMMVVTSETYSIHRRTAGRLPCAKFSFPPNGQGLDGATRKRGLGCEGWPHVRERHRKFRRSWSMDTTRLPSQTQCSSTDGL